LIYLSVSIDIFTGADSPRTVFASHGIFESKEKNMDIYDACGRKINFSYSFGKVSLGRAGTGIYFVKFKNGNLWKIINL